MRIDSYEFYQEYQQTVRVASTEHRTVTGDPVDQTALIRAVYTTLFKDTDFPTDHGNMRTYSEWLIFFKCPSPHTVASTFAVTGAL